MPEHTLYIHITGIVQGVGFRPFVYNLAQKAGLTGWVCNSAKGVEIQVTGPVETIENFISEIENSPPPLATIDHITTKEMPFQTYTSFEIFESQDEESDFIPVSADVGICEDCKTEMFDPANRRYRYPFINCTNCGPRFSIIKKIPYDRPNTSMAGFPLCEDCQAEYEHPADRRFHAQPVACAVCGPKIWYEEFGTLLSEGEEALQQARQAIKQGKIIAVKGLGGFHLVCDGNNQDAVMQLRARKNRSDKPFAMMAPSLDIITKYCQLSPIASTFLSSPQSPIMLLPTTSEGKNLLVSIAPGQNRLGFMLPYTPLHHLLIEQTDDFPEILVMTSANLSEEPIAYGNEEARSRLETLADGFLLHNRPIFMRIDDSVFTENIAGIYPIRRARGYAPSPIRLAQNSPPILGTGSLFKNTFCLTRDHYAFVSHHIGDLENYETLQAYQQAIPHYQDLFRIHPKAIAVDMHPDYLARQYGLERAKKENLPIFPVQHHHAHIAACLAENAWPEDEPVIGLSYDGTGYGTDGVIWGGEILKANYSTFKRAYHLQEMPLPGGDTAIHNPARLAYAYLLANGIELDSSLPPLRHLSPMERSVLEKQVTLNINTVKTTSMGRLFDVVASLIGIRHKVNYEAQAAIELEAIADPHETGHYPMEVKSDIITIGPMLNEIIRDFQNNIPMGVISAKMHNSIIHMSLEICLKIQLETGLKDVALSGGVWQNIYLLNRMLKELRKTKITPLIHHQLPPNDACISLGQVMVAEAQMNYGISGE